MLEVLKKQGAVIITREAFTGNRSFNQVLKETKKNNKRHPWQLEPFGREKHFFAKVATGPAGE